MDSDASHIRTVCPSYSVALELLYFMNSFVKRQNPVKDYEPAMKRRKEIASPRRCLAVSFSNLQKRPR